MKSRHGENATAKPLRRPKRRKKKAAKPKPQRDPWLDDIDLYEERGNAISQRNRKRRKPVRNISGLLKLGILIVLITRGVALGFGIINLVLKFQERVPLDPDGSEISTVMLIDFGFTAGAIVGMLIVGSAMRPRNWKPYAATFLAIVAGVFYYIDVYSIELGDETLRTDALEVIKQLTITLGRFAATFGSLWLWFSTLEDVIVSEKFYRYEGVGDHLARCVLWICTGFAAVLFIVALGFGLSLVLPVLGLLVIGVIFLIAIVGFLLIIYLTVRELILLWQIAAALDWN